MVDSHTAALGSAVTVSGGLFNVQLGGGTISDGSGPGTYTSLSDLFRDYGTVWLAIRIGGEDLSPRVRLVSSAYALNAAHAVNAAKFDDRLPSSFLDTSATAQTKSGPLTIASTSGYGIQASGPTAGGYFEDSSNSGRAYVGYGNEGIAAYGELRGGYFEDSNGSGYAIAGAGDFGISGYGNTAGGYFKDRDSSAYAYAGYGDVGVSGYGSTAGAHFEDSDSSGRADLGVGNIGITASGDSEGGHFTDASESGLARVAYGNYGIYAQGSSAGGWFKDSTDSGVAYLGSGDIGIHASGTFAAGLFDNPSTSGSAYLARGDEGVWGWGNTMGGRFEDEDSSGEGYVGYGDYGIYAVGNSSGGWFADLNSSGWAKVGDGSYKIYGSGTVSFVQNHPLEKDRVIVYAAPEGDEVAVYTRGTARLVDGEARVALGPTFQWVTNPDIGLTAHLTPRGAWSSLYVVDLSTAELVVRGVDGPKDGLFDYIVYGLRLGFEESSIVQEKTAEAFIPAMTDHRQRYEAHPELRAFNALERFRGMSAAAGLALSSGMPRAQALRAAIHEYEPAVDRAVPEILGTVVPHPDRPPEPAASAARVRPPALADTAPVSAVSAVQRTLLPVSDNVESGDLLALDPLRPGSVIKSRIAGDPLVVAIAAGVPEEIDGVLQVPVWDTLYARVKADASTGVIQPGDLLVASALAGHAMKAPDGAPAGSIIGKALEALEAGQGHVRLLVTHR